MPRLIQAAKASIFAAFEVGKENPWSPALGTYENS